MDETGNREASPSPIRVLVADDSVVMRSALARLLKHSPRIQLCGFAVNGAEAVEKARLLRPDVITLDVMMPVLDGMGALREIMQERPCPVIMVSSLTHRDAEISLEALAAGAFHYIPKEDLYHADSPFKIQCALLDHIEAVAQSPQSPRRKQMQLSKPHPFATSRRHTHGVHGEPVPEIIAIGASTGGPRALQEVLAALPGDFPAPVVVAQHMPPSFTEALATRLDGLCKVRVHEARQGEALRPGTVCIAPAGKHMTVFPAAHSGNSICLSDFPADTLHKPSVDVMMLSVASVFSERALGVILTGMGTDGLLGMTAIHEHGGITVGQDEATSAVYGMPRACAEHGVLQKVLSPPAIGEEILARFCFRMHA